MPWLARPPPSLRALWSNPARTPARPFSFTSNCYGPRLSRASVREVPRATSFREHIARTTGVKAFSEAVKHPTVSHQIIFFAVGSLATFSIAAQAANMDTLHWHARLKDSGTLVWKIRDPTSDEMRRARYYELGKKLQTGLVSLKESMQQFPQTLAGLAVWAYVQVAQPILDTTEGKRICWAIGAVNTAVWAAWQFPKMQPFMMRHFTHNPLSGMSYTMLTCVFSHRSFLHLLFNSMALASFGSAASQYLMKEQANNPHGMREASIKWHFLAFYISAGLFSSMTSHVLMSKVRFPRTVAQLVKKPASEGALATKAAPADKILPSLGASGAIYGTVTLTALAFPDTEIALLIPPTFPIPIQTGVAALVGLDLLGALRGWRMFDHYAHLGGAAFGALYYMYGPRMWNMFRIANMGPQVPKKAGTEA